MVELTASAAVALAAGTGAVVLVLLVLAVTARRRTTAMNRRLAAITARLEQPGARPRQERDSIGRLEQLAESSVLRSVEAEAAQARLAGALRGVGVGVVVCDETGAEVFRNDAAHPLAEVPGGEAEVAGMLLAALAGERPQREFEVFDLSARRLVVTAHPLDDGTRPVGAVAVVEDRSEGRRLDGLRRDFLATVTAELRGPVAALEALAATVADDLAGDVGATADPAVTGRLAVRLATEARRVGRVIDDVAELSHLDAAVARPAGAVPVGLLVAEALDGAQAVAAGAGVGLEASGPPAPLSVVGGRRHLVSALRHLVESAARHSPAGAVVTVQATEEDGWVLVAVTDQGQAGAGRDGLGLAIASRAAAGHGGEVLVDSSPGTGSVVTLKLPAGPQPAT